MTDLKELLKQQGLISSFGQPLGSSYLEETCEACGFICLACLVFAIGGGC
jgi:hypothetical protein